MLLKDKSSVRNSGAGHRRGLLAQAGLCGGELHMKWQLWLCFPALWALLHQSMKQSMKHRVTFLGCVFYAHHTIFRKSHLMQIVTKFSIAWRQFYQTPPSFLFPTALSGRLLGKKKYLLFLKYNWIKIFLTSLCMQNYLSQISTYVQNLSIFQHGLSIENINPKVSKELKKSKKSILRSMLTPLCHWFHRKVRCSAEVAHWASLHHKVISQPDLLCHKTSVLSFSGLLRRKYGMGVERSGAEHIALQLQELLHDPDIWRFHYSIPETPPEERLR